MTTFAKTVEVSMIDHAQALLAELSGGDEFSVGRSDPAFLEYWNRRARTVLIFACAETMARDLIPDSRKMVKEMYDE